MFFGSEASVRGVSASCRGVREEVSCCSVLPGSRIGGRVIANAKMDCAHRGVTRFCGRGVVKFWDRDQLPKIDFWSDFDGFMAISDVIDPHVRFDDTIAAQAHDAAELALRKDRRNTPASCRSSPKSPACAASRTLRGETKGSKNRRKLEIKWDTRDGPNGHQPTASRCDSL